MLQKIEYLGNHCKTEPEDQLNDHWYRIVDMDFMEEWSGGRTYATADVVAIINCYKSKELDVAYNLFWHHRYIMGSRLEHIPAYIAWFDKNELMYRVYSKSITEYHRRYSQLAAFS